MVLIILGPVDIRGVESNVLHTLQLINSDKKLLYTDPTRFPFDITQYTPLYYILTTQLTHLFGISSEIGQLKIFAKLFSTVYLAILILILYKFLRKLDVNKDIISVILLSVPIYTFPWYNLARPDILSILFFLLSFYYLWIYSKNPQFKYIMIIALFQALSILSKQTGLLYISVFLAGFFLKRQFSHIFLFLSILSLFLCLFLLIFQLIGYDLSFIVSNIYNGLKNGESLKNAFNFVYFDYSKYFLIFTFLIIITFNNLSFVDKRESTLRLILISNFIIFILATVLSLKKGSAINYYNDSIIFQFIFLGYIYSKSNSAIKKAIKYALIVLGIHVSLIHLSIYTPKIAYQFFAEDIKHKNSLNPVQNFLRDSLQNDHFYTNNRNIALDYPRHSVFFSMDIHQLAFEQKAFNYDVMKDAFKDGSIKYIVAYEPLTSIFDIKIDQYYSITLKTGNYIILKSKRAYPTN